MSSDARSVPSGGTISQTNASQQLPICRPFDSRQLGRPVDVLLSSPRYPLKIQTEKRSSESRQIGVRESRQRYLFKKRD